MINIEDYVVFQDYGMSKSFLIQKDYYEDFQRLLANIMVVATLTEYDVKCTDRNLLPNPSGFFNMCIFSFYKNNKVKINLVINITKHDSKTYLFHSIEVICIRDYSKKKDENLNIFKKEYKKHKLFEGYERINTNGLIFVEKDPLFKSLTVFMRLILLLK